jgi:hypothetical protein
MTKSTMVAIIPPNTIIVIPRAIIMHHRRNDRLLLKQELIKLSTRSSMLLKSIDTFEIGSFPILIEVVHSPDLSVLVLDFDDSIDYFVAKNISHSIH